MNFHVSGMFVSEVRNECLNPEVKVATKFVRSRAMILTEKGAYAHMQVGLQRHSTER